MRGKLWRAPLDRRGDAGRSGTDANGGGKTLFRRRVVRIWTLSSGQGAEVLVFSIKTKVHAIGLASRQGAQAIEPPESRYRGLVVGRPTKPFSVGADLQRCSAVHVGWLKAIGEKKRSYRMCCMRLKYAAGADVSVVSDGACGGCELALHSARRRQSGELHRPGRSRRRAIPVAVA